MENVEKHADTAVLCCSVLFAFAVHQALFFIIENYFYLFIFNLI